MESTNSFDKGLHRTNSPQMQPEGSYIDALNWIRNDSGRLINEDLENIIHTFSEDAILLGHCPIRNEFICFLKIYNTTDGIWNSVIGTFSEGVYTEIYNDANHPLYKLNFTNEIDCVARIVSSGSRVVYFVEDGNPIRRFNLDLYINNPTEYNGFEDFNLQLTVKYPKVSTLVFTGGTLTASAYSFIVRYVDKNDNKTQWNIPSRMLSIVPGNALQEIDGGAPPGENTDKRVQITIENTDLNYAFIEIGVIKYEELTNDKVIKSLGLFKNDTKIVINHNNDSELGESIDLDLVQDVPIYYDSAKCIEQKDNYLILSNLTVKKYDENFQAVANNIVVTTYIQNVNFDNKRDINVRGFDVSTDDPHDPTTNTGDGEYIGFGTVDYNGVVDQFYGAESPNGTITDAYQNTTNLFKDTSFKKGFQPDEIYSFSITPIYKDGSIGFAYHIPCNSDTFAAYSAGGTGFSTTKKYISTLLYPDNIGLTGGIRHHLMPSVDLVNSDNNTVSILRVKFFNINIPASLQNKMQGYIIGFQQRNTDSNTKIIDEGIAIPYNYWSKDTKYYNGVLNGRGWFYGDYEPSESVDEPRSVIATGTEHPYSMYYSPSTQVGLEIKEGFKFHVHRNALQNYYNARATSTNKIYTRPSILRHIRNTAANWTYDAEFFDGNKVISGYSAPTTIKKALRNNGEYDSNTSNIIDGKVIMGGGNNFTHIETEGEIWPTTLNNPSFVDYRIVSFYFRDDEPNVNKKTVQLSIRDQQYLSIARVINDIPNQYGNLYNAEYLVSETILDPSQTEVEIEGDTYTFKHWFNIRSIHKQKIANTDRQFNFDLVAGVWLTSQNNFALRHRESDEGLYYPETKTFFSAINSADMFNNYWWLRSLGYNKQYSTLNNNKLNFPKPLLFQENNVYSNRSIYSKQTFESELTDQYRYFPYIQYHDIPKDRGVITDTFVFNNNFFHHTEYGLWQSFFNPNTTQATSQGDVVLGNAGIFTIPSKLILDIKGGYMGTLDKSGINTPFGRIFIDHSQKKVFLFAGESPVEISDLGLFSHFRDYISKENAGKYSFGYDWENKRILLSLHSIENTAIRPDFPNIFNTTFETARNLEDLSENVKTRYAGLSTIFKFFVNNKKKVKITVEVSADTTLKIFKVVDGQRQQIQTISVEGSSGTFYTYDIMFDNGEYFIEFTSQVVCLKLIDFMSFESTKLSISYYPKTQTWTSFHDFTPSFYLTLNGNSYAFNPENSSFYNLKNVNGIKKNSYITFVENSLPDAFKRFDKMEINTMSGGKDSKYFPGEIFQDDYTFIDKSFSSIQCWNDRQNSKVLPLEYSHVYQTNFLNGYEVDKVPINYYRNSFHIELPLDAVINPYVNIFEPSNLDVNAEFRSHLKGKFLYNRLSYNEDKPLVLNYIKTFFKPTVA